MDPAIDFAPRQDWLDRHAVSGCEDVLYVPHFADVDASAMISGIPWREETIRIFGREVKVPRLCAWYGDPGVEYRYSGVNHAASEWPDWLANLRDTLWSRVGARFNFVLANLYRDGSDAIGWHADDERDLGPQPCIASLSFGAARPFRIRSRDGRRQVELMLEHGSLLLMWGASQRNWKHALPRVRAEVGARVNLTFRHVRSRAT